jgi:hypothetical protein
MTCTFVIRDIYKMLGDTKSSPKHFTKTLIKVLHEVPERNSWGPQTNYFSRLSHFQNTRQLTQKQVSKLLVATQSSPKHFTMHLQLSSSMHTCKTLPMQRNTQASKLLKWFEENSRWQPAKLRPLLLISGLWWTYFTCLICPCRAAIYKSRPKTK